MGPRPERPAFCAEFEKRIHGWHYRTMVTPGLSGLAQVTGGYDLLPKEKVVLDPWDYDSNTYSCDRLYSVDYRSYVKYECDKALDAGIGIVVLYNAACVNRTKCPDAVKYEGKHVAMKHWEDGELKWDYQAVKKAFE